MKKTNVLTTFLICANCTIFANSAETTTEPAIELAPAVSTAMRFSDSVYDTPVNTTRISAQQVSNANLESVAEALNRYSDVYFSNMSSSPFLAQPAMRGFGVNGQTRILVQLDGQKLNPIDLGNINWGAIQIQDVENIEVLSGAQTAMYGNFAESGVIKISTKKWGKNGAIARATYGEFGEYSFFGTATYSDENYYASASANYFHNSGFFADSLSWNKSATLNAGMRLDSKNEIGLYANVGNMFVSWPGYIYAGNVSELKDKFPNHTNHDQENRIDYLTTTASWQNDSTFGEGSANLGFNIRDNNQYASWGDSNTKLYTISFDPKYRVKLGAEDNSYVEGGLDFYYDNLDLQEAYSSAEINRYTISPWISGKAQLNDIFSVVAAARYETAINDVSTTTTAGNADKTIDGISAQLGLNARISKNWNVYARFDQIHHYATVEEQFSIHGWGAHQTNLDPEYGQNYEIGTNFSKWGFTLKGSLFYMHLNDEIAYGYDQYGSGSNRNIGETDRLGAQIRIDYNYDDKFGAFTSWQFVDAEYASGVNNGRKVACVPPITSKSAIWIKPIKYTMLELGFIWADKKYQDDYLSPWAPTNADKIPQYYSLDLTLNVYPCEHAKIFFGISNITNHMNCTYATYNSWYMEPARTIRCGLELNF